MDMTRTIRRLHPCAAALGLLLSLVPALPAAANGLQPLDTIQRVAETHARRLLTGEDLASVDVRAGALDTRLRLRECEQALEAFSNQDASQMRGGRATIGVRCNGASPWTLYVPVSISAQATVVRLREPLQRGTILNESHLELVSAPVTGLPQHYMGRLDQVVGQELLRNVGPGTIATLHLLKARSLISKGQEVVILARGGRVEVKMAGVALQNGQQGERINVQNSASGRTVEAVIVNESTVRVQM